MQNRNTATRDRLRRIVRQRGDPCHLCGYPIDYSLPHLSPGEFTIDHIVPYSKGGPDVIENIAAAHRSCNRDKSDGPMRAGGPREPAELKRLRTY